MSKNVSLKLGQGSLKVIESVPFNRMDMVSY